MNKKRYADPVNLKRRELLRTLAGASALSVTGLPRLQGEEQFTVKPIRGLLSRDGKLWQPIRIGSSAASSLTSAVATVNGQTFRSRLTKEQNHELEILLPPVQTPSEITVSAQGNVGPQTKTVTVHPVRKVTVYVLPHSHHDLGYTDLQAPVEEKQIQNIDRGIALAKQTANNPEGSRFVWNLEVLWGADLYFKRGTPARRAEFEQAVRNGWLALNGMYANELTGLCRPAELLQLFSFGKRLAAQCKVELNSAMISDVPGFTWGTATAMKQAGIRYFSAAPNWFDRIGTLMAEWQDKPFWWVSPSGQHRVLVWIPWTGYALSHVIKQFSPEWVTDYQGRLDQVQFPYDISYVRWSGHGDNAVPDGEICDFIKGWNAEYQWPQFRISSTSEAFSALEKRHGARLPEFRGDLTPYWEDGAGSSAYETALSRSAADKLTQAQALSVMRQHALPNDQVQEAWRDVLLYSEHTWGAWNSVSDSETQFVKDQWNVKRQFATDAARMASQLVTQELPPPDTAAENAVAIYNTTAWPRSELVFIPAGLSKGGDLVTDHAGKPLPSQRLKSGELAAFVQVAALAAVQMKVSAGSPHQPPAPVTAENGVLDNGLLHARIDTQTGNIVELRLRGVSTNLVDTTGGGSVNEFLYLPGSKVSDLQRSGPAAVSVVEQGPLFASLSIKSSAPGCKELLRTISLAAGSDQLEIVNTVDKQPVPLNPTPGKDGPGGEFAQRGNKESLQFAFPFNVANGQIRVDVPFAVMEPDKDQLPGSCKNWLPVSRWVDVSNDRHGVACISLDAPLIEIGEISANLLGSQRDPAVWRKEIGPTQRFYSWVMNNHWGTNYRAYQEGPVQFRYVLYPHQTLQLAALSKLAIGKSQPLLITSHANPTEGARSFLTVEPDDVIVAELKTSFDGKAFIVRLFGASGEARHVHLKWSEDGTKHVWLSDEGEARIKPLKNPVSVPAWELVTLRVEKA